MLHDLHSLPLIARPKDMFSEATHRVLSQGWGLVVLGCLTLVPGASMLKNSPHNEFPSGYSEDNGLLAKYASFNNLNDCDCCNEDLLSLNCRIPHVPYPLLFVERAAWIQL